MCMCSHKVWFCVYVCANLELPFDNQPNPPLKYIHPPTQTHARTHTYTHICTGYFRSRAPDRVSRSINYISAPAIKQGYYQAAAHRSGKAWPIKGCCDVGAGACSCDSNTEWQLMLSRERGMERGKTDDWGRISKEKTEGSVQDRNERISLNHLSPSLHFFLNITLRMTGDKSAKKQFFINRVYNFFKISDFYKIAKLIFLSLLGLSHPWKMQEWQKRDSHKSEGEKATHAENISTLWFSNSLLGNSPLWHLFDKH